ncbi:baeRF12 domain-containing protein [Maricaulis salignorans]|uniref:Protein required for attachment to host cells n=1 Tax=Maricaulis salignorans TaxID=144026 RepID=A0A1G9SW43_9PROT|nr:host attachment family protein [Maricaulis salignorans]SDM39604.1 Protein required for attachment to host cells [Maricaulis salignorans]
MSTPIDAITWIAALDGGKALIWRNEGFDDQPNLKLVDQDELDNPPAHDHSSDRPGRISKTGGARSAVEHADGHMQAKHDFVQSMVGRLNREAEKGSFDRLVLLAPAHVLGEARPHYSPALKDKLLERERDVVNQSTDKIEAQFVAALAE